VIDLLRFELIDQFHEVDGIGQVAIVKEKLHPVNVRILIKMVDSVGIKGAGPPNYTMDLIALLQQ
jgi:hypothetical protein